MRRLLLILNSVCTLLFASFFIYTFLAIAHLKFLAREFVTEKTLHYSAGAIEVLEVLLDEPVVGQFVSKVALQAARTEIETYREDPATYVADLTRHRMAKLDEKHRGPVALKVAALKEGIRKFYDDTLNALIRDLRIFSGTNFVTSLAAIVMAIRARHAIGPSLVVLSLLLLMTVIFNSYVYIDDLSFFRILFACYPGWGYPVMVGFCVWILHRISATDLKARLEISAGKNFDKSSE